MSKQIHIGSVSIPLNEFAISGTAWLGIKKAGKTYGAKGVAEQLIDHDVPLIVFDAIGVWRFLKAPNNESNGKGYKIVVAGGEEPDIPLSAHNSSEIVRAAMRSNISLVIDLYDPKLSKSDWRKIVQTCFHTLLYENKKHGTRYIILEEAAEYCPQKVYDGETYAAVEKLVRMGGNAGLGIALINQRSQEINKSVLDLCDNLVLMRQRGNAAIEAVQKWMDKVSPDIADKITASLPNMTGGQCWVWAENSDTPVETRTHKLHSFHPDRTKGAVMLKNTRQVDTAEFVSELLAELPKVVEEIKSKDPAELKKQLSDARRELEQARSTLERQKPVSDVALESEIKILKHALKRATDHILSTTELDFNDSRQSIANLKDHASELFHLRVKDDHKLNKIKFGGLAVLKDLGVVGENLKPVTPKSEPSKLPETDYVHRPFGPHSIETTNDNGSIPKGELAILIACKQHAPKGCTRAQLTGLTGYRRSSRDAYIARLKQKGYLIDDRDRFTISPEGDAALPPHIKPMPTGQDLVDYWIRHLPKGESLVFKSIVEHGSAISRDRITEITGYMRSSRDAYIARLGSRELIESTSDGIIAAKELFES